MFNLINRQPDLIYLYAKDLYEAKYHFLINTRENTGLKHFNDPKVFIEYSNNVDVIYKNIKKYNPKKKRKMSIAFVDMIADMPINKKLNPIVTGLFIRGRKLNIYLVFYTQSCFAVPKNITVNSTHYVIMKIPNKHELQHIAFDHSSHIDFKDFLNLYEKCTAKPYSFLVIDATLASDNPLRFRKDLVKKYKN